jgi:hypothetical protein
MPTAYNRLIQVKGCGLKTAERILSRFNKGQELTDREHNFVREAEIFGYGASAWEFAERLTVRDLCYESPDVGGWVIGSFMVTGLVAAVIFGFENVQATLFTAIPAAAGVWFVQ